MAGITNKRQAKWENVFFHQTFPLEPEVQEAGGPLGGEQQEMAE